MPIGIGGVSFQGPYTRHEILSRRPGVFAVLDGRSLPPLHAEKTDDVRQAVEDHAGRGRWQEACDNLAFAVFYTSVDRSQRRIERAVRREFGLSDEPAGTPETNGGPPPAVRKEEPPIREGRERREPPAPGRSEEKRDRSFRFHVPSTPAARRRHRVS